MLLQSHDMNVLAFGSTRLLPFLPFLGSLRARDLCARSSLTFMILLVILAIPTGRFCDEVCHCSHSVGRYYRAVRDFSGWIPNKGSVLMLEATRLLCDKGAVVC